jgi:CoA:oxalate CoA-transferase
MPGPLAGIRVLDFTWALAGPYCTLILADLGAEVIKVEWPGLTDEERGEGPYVDGISSYFLSLNRGKKSIALDLRDVRAREAIYHLIPTIDVVVENFTPGTISRMGLGYEELSSRHAGLIFASCSGFGQSGPRSSEGAMDIIVQALSGIMSVTGQPGGPPTRVGVSIGDIAAGLYLAIGVLAAVVERDRSGKGQAIDVAMLDAQVALLENAIVRYSATRDVPERLGSRHALTTPFQAFRTADGWIAVAGVKDWDLFCIKLGRPELAIDPRFLTNALRNEHHGELEPLLSAAFQTLTTHEWESELHGAALVAPVRTIDQVVADEALRQRGAIVPMPLGGAAGRTIDVAGNPIKLSRTPGPSVTAAPALGAHTRVLLRSLAGLSDTELDRLKSEGIAGMACPAGGTND